MKRTLSFVLAVVMLFCAVPFMTVKTEALSYQGSSSYKSSVYYKRLTNVKLTGNQRTDVANIALSQLGYHESSSASDLSGTSNSSGNCTEYGRWYGGQGPWCAVFLSWCLSLAGVKTSVVKKSARANANSFGIKYYSKYSYNPKIGDFVFYNYEGGSGTDHVGIIVGIGDGYVNTIEGNTTKNEVTAKKRYISFSNLKGFGAPEYSDYSYPRMKSAVNTAAGTEIKWSSVVNAKSYKLYRKTGSSKWKAIAVISASKGTFYIDKKVKNNTSYTYTVRADSGDGYGTYQKSGKTVKFLATPIIKGAVNSEDALKISWNKITGAAGYKLYRKTANSGWKVIAEQTGTAFSDKTAMPGVKYYYVVKAVNKKTLSGGKSFSIVRVLPEKETIPETTSESTEPATATVTEPITKSVTENTLEISA